MDKMAQIFMGVSCQASMNASMELIGKTREKKTSIWEHPIFALSNFVFCEDCFKLAGRRTELLQLPLSQGCLALEDWVTLNGSLFAPALPVTGPLIQNLHWHWVNRTGIWS